MRARLVLVGILAGAVGCGPAVVSRKIGTDGATGVPYALPQTVVEADIEITEVPAGLFTATVTAAGDEKQQPKVVEALANLLSLSAAEIKKKLADLPWKLEPAPIDVSRAEDIKKKVEAAGGSVLLTPNESEFRIDLTLTPQRVPDWSRGYVVDTAPHPFVGFFSSDDWTVKVTPSGLLDEVNSTRTDQTGEVISSLARTGISAFIAAVGFGVPAPPIKAAPTEREREDATRKALSDLKGKHHIVTANLKELLKKDNPPSEIKGRSGTAVAVLTVKARRLDTDPPTTKLDDEVDGILTTVDRPVVITAELALETVALAKVELLAQVPDDAPVVAVPIERAPFVTATSKVDLDNGRAASAAGTKPSSALAIVKIPEGIASSVAALPAQILQLKFDIASKQQQLTAKEQEIAQALAAGNTEQQRKVLEAELGRLKAEADVLQKQQLLQQAQATGDLQQQKAVLDAELARLKAEIELQKLKNPPPP